MILYFFIRIPLSKKKKKKYKNNMDLFNHFGRPLLMTTEFLFRKVEICKIKERKAVTYKRKTGIKENIKEWRSFPSYLGTDG